MSVNLDEIKKDCIENLNHYVDMKALERTNADLLIKLINNADTPNEVISIAQLGTTYKRTGLHYDTRLEKFDDGNTIKYLKKNNALSFTDESSLVTNKLIIGDNYDALLNLLIEYKGKIDVIYIDPPYGKDSMGEFAQTNYENAITRDNLLSMLYPRLLLAKKLLSPQGVIFCSIDDRNHSYLKCLFDEIFGEQNLLGNIIWQSATDNNPTQIAIEHEYIICYANNKNNLSKWKIKSNKIDLIQDKYNELKKENHDISVIQMQLRKWINKNKNDLKGFTHYNCVDENGVFTANTNSSDTKLGNYLYDIIHPITNKPCPKPVNGWRWPEETFWEYDKEGQILWGEDETTQPHVKKRLETVTEQLKSVIYEDGRIATSMLKDIFSGYKVFDNPKPVNLIKTLLKFSTREDSIILDFFAGSGTTGQAVLELNKTEGGKRQFILVQLKESLEALESKTNKNAIEFLDSIGMEHFLSNLVLVRLKRIMTGDCYQHEEFDWIKKNEAYGGGLEVCEIEKVANFETTKGKTPFDVIDETLYGQGKFNNLKDKIDWVCRNFEVTQSYLKEKGEDDVTRD